MADEERENDVDERYAEYIEQLKTLKENTVPKSEYEAIRKANKQLLESVFDGTYKNGKNGDGGNHDEAKTKVDNTARIKELRNELYGRNPVENISDRAYVEKILELRSRIMQDGGEDPMVPRGPKYTPTNADVEAAQRLADGLQYCLDQSKGDDAAFKVALMSITK